MILRRPRQRTAGRTLTPGLFPVFGWTMPNSMTNSIMYYPDSATKVKEIQELLAPVVQFKETKEWKVPQLPTPPPTVKIPAPVPIPPPPSVTRTIRIVLVDEK